MKRRVLPLALALALCLGLTVPTAFADEPHTYEADGYITVTNATGADETFCRARTPGAEPESYIAFCRATSSSIITFELLDGGTYSIQGFNYIESEGTYDGHPILSGYDTGYWESEELGPGTYTLTQADLRAKLPEFDFVWLCVYDMYGWSNGYIDFSNAPASANLGTGVSIPSKSGNLLIESTTAQETMQYNGESVTVYSVPANVKAKKYIATGYTYTLNVCHATVENGVIQKSEQEGTWTYSSDDSSAFWYSLGENDNNPGDMYILEITCTETGETWLSGRGGTEYVFLKFSGTAAPSSSTSADASSGSTFTAGKYETWGGLALNFYGSYANWRALQAANPGVTLKEGAVITLPATLNGAKLLSYPTAGEGETLYTVKAGDTLGSISAAYFGTSSRYMEIFNRNSDRLTKPTLIYEGQIIVLPSKTAQTQQPAAQPASPSSVQVTVSALNVRSGPGMSYGVISVVYQGDVLNIVETSGSWGKLESGGWIYLKGYTQAV